MIAQHRDHGGQVPRLHTPDQVGLFGARSYRHSRGPEETNNLVHVRALAIVNLFEHLLFGVGLRHIGSCSQGIRPELQGQHLSHRPIATPGSDFTIVILQDRVQNRIFALQAIRRQQACETGFLRGFRPFSIGVHVQLSLGEFLHQPILWKRRSIALDQLLQAKVGLLQAPHVKLFRALWVTGGGEKIPLPCTLKFRCPEREWGHLQRLQCHPAATKLCIQGFVGFHRLRLCGLGRGQCLVGDRHSTLFVLPLEKGPELL